jgi:hypothetical protein
MIVTSRCEGGGGGPSASRVIETVPISVNRIPRAATPTASHPGHTSSPPLPPALGFENDEDDDLSSSGAILQASNNRRAGRPTAPPRRSSSGSLASTVAAKRRASKVVEVIEPSGQLAKTVTTSANESTSKRGYDCCSKRENSSALAALVGVISLATLMTSLVTDLWLDTDEWIPSVIDQSTTSDHSPPISQPNLPNVQPRHEESASAASGVVKRVHFAVGLWTVCPSHEDAGGQPRAKGKRNKICITSLG